MKIGIFTNEMYTNAQKDSIGSSRIRCNWLLPYWPEAEEFKIAVKYDVVIFQKAYFIEYMKIFDGIKILDLCDPDWVEGKPVVESIELCDAVTVSSQGLYDYLQKITKKPIFLIPDRVDMNAHQEKKEHTAKAQSVVWFGYHHNQVVLDAVLPALKRLGLNLTVISDLPYMPNTAIDGIDKTWLTSHIKNIKYDQQTINQEIIEGGDFVLNYRPESGKFIYKSENKTIIAWALGMPVAKTVEELERFIDPEERKKEAQLRLDEIKEKYTTDKSVVEYKNVIENIQNTKAGREGHTESSN